MTERLFIGTKSNAWRYIKDLNTVYEDIRHAPPTGQHGVYRQVAELVGIRRHQSRVITDVIVRRKNGR